MIAIKALLAHLSRPNVSEITLRSNCRPTAQVDGDFREIDFRVLSSDDLLQVFFAAGGSRYVEGMGDKPVQWRTRIEGTGTVVNTAFARGNHMEAHIAVRDTQPEASAPRATVDSAMIKAKAPREHGEHAVPDAGVKARGRPRRSESLPSEPVGPTLADPSEWGMGSPSGQRSARPTATGLSPVAPTISTLPPDAFALLEDAGPSWLRSQKRHHPKGSEAAIARPPAPANEGGWGRSRSNNAPDDTRLGSRRAPSAGSEGACCVGERPAPCCQSAGSGPSRA